MSVLRQSSADTVLDGAFCLTDFYNDNPKYQDLPGDYEARQSRNSIIHIGFCDITTVRLDAIVCPTQTNLCLDPVGLCSKIWSVGGFALKQTCRNRGKLDVGTSFVTRGYNLPAQNVIFTAGPSPKSPFNYEERLDILRNNYLSCLDTVHNHGNIRTVAFPCLGTGGGGLNIADANRVATRAIRDWLDKEENRSSVDVILLCMLSQDQWLNFLPDLLKAFPHGLDLQGNNLEDLRNVPEKYLSLPATSLSTNILCYKYNAGAFKTIVRHFHRIVDCCGRALNYVVSLKRRFRNSAIFMPKCKSEHQIIILHSGTQSMIEVKVTRFNYHMDNIRLDICEDLDKCITDYFQTRLENITPCDMYMRCDQASWGQDQGLWKYDEVAALSEGPEICDKHEFSEDYHQIWKKDMLSCWNGSKVLSPRSMESPQNQIQSKDKPGSRREPEENSVSSSDWNDTRSLNSAVQKRPNPLTYPQPRQSKENPGSRREPEENSVSSSDWNDTRSLNSGIPKRPNTLTFYPQPNEDTKSPSSCTSAGSSSSWSMLSSPGYMANLQYPNSLSTVDPTLAAAFAGTPGSTPGGYNKAETRKKQKLTTKLLERDKNNQRKTEKMNTKLSVKDDSGNETESLGGESPDASEFGSQASIRSQQLHKSTPCRVLGNRDLIKLARQMGSCQKKVGLYLDLSESEIQNAMLKDKEPEVQGFHIIKKWMANNGDKADLETLFKIYHECDIDVYPLKQEFGIL